METFAYSNFPRNSGMPGVNFPMRIPDSMHRATQTVRYLSKKLIPVLLLSSMMMVLWALCTHRFTIAEGVGFED